MRYVSVIQSVKNISKDFMQHPRFVRLKFYGDFRDLTFGSNKFEFRVF